MEKKQQINCQFFKVHHDYGQVDLSDAKSAQIVNVCIPAA